MVRADFVTGIALILVSLYVIFESWRMPRIGEPGGPPVERPRPRAGVPRRGPHRLRRGPGDCDLSGREATVSGCHIAKAREVLAEPGNQRLLITAVLTIAYAGFLIGRMPYQLATGLFIFAFIVLFEWESGLTPARYARLFGVAAILAVVITGWS